MKSQEIALRANKAATSYLLHMNFISGYLFPYSLYGEDRLAKIHRNSDRLFTAANYNKIYRKGVKVDKNVRLSNSIYLGQCCRVEEGSFI